MSKIIGNETIIQRARALPPGDKTSYVNWQAIQEMPKEFEALVVELKFNFAADFVDVGNGNYMPTPQLVYRIAEARGVEGGTESICSPIIEEVDINPMLMKSLEDEPTTRKMTVGRSVTKYATRLGEDGRQIKSSPCTCEFNVWERCCELWAKEEMYTEGYTKASNYPNKYDSPLKRKAHFTSEMKFAHSKAETKAHLKAIRELACLMTGYRKEDLSKGSLYFARVQRSRRVLQLETAARLQNIAKGIQAPLEAQERLYGPPAASEGGFEEPPAPPQKEETKREKLLKIYEYYKDENILKPEMQETSTAIIKWLKTTPEAEKDPVYWPKACKSLEVIENSIGEEWRMKHDKIS